MRKVDDMNSWCTMERALLSLGLVREERCQLNKPDVVMRTMSFRLPAAGMDCFRRLDTGCWYSGVPSTGSLREMLRTTGMLEQNGFLQLPGESTLQREGFLAVDVRYSAEGSFRKFRMWWIDRGSPKAFRVIARFRRNAPVFLKSI